MPPDSSAAANNSSSNNHAYPSPLEGEQAVTPIMRTEGPEQATQVEKVDELGSQAIFLRLGAEDPSGTPGRAAAAKTPSCCTASGTRKTRQCWRLPGRMR